MATQTPRSARHESIRRAWYKFTRNKLSVIGLVLVVLIVLAAIFAPFITPYPHHAGTFVDFPNASQPPNVKYLLGTDIFGRDILTRIIFAFRGALLMGLGVIAMILPLGVIVGLITGYYKGTWIDTLMMRITDIFLALPAIILALAVAAVLRPTLFNSMMAVALSWWPWYARLTYGMASSVRNEFFILAAEVSGGSKLHIIVKEILPNCLSPIFSKMALDFGWVILIGATLSFVGLGEQPPTPALGTMVADGAKFLPSQWWIPLFPAIAIMIIILAFNLLGDGIRDMLSTEEV